MNGKIILASNSYFQYPKYIANYLGDVNATVLLCALCDKDNFAEMTVPDYDGWFYYTSTAIQCDTGIKPKTQQRTRKVLKELNILEEKMKGLPAKLYFRLNTDVIEKLIHDSTIYQEEFYKGINKKINSEAADTESENYLSQTRNYRVDKNEGAIDSDVSTHNKNKIKEYNIITAGQPAAPKNTKRNFSHNTLKDDLQSGDVLAKKPEKKSQKELADDIVESPEFHLSEEVKARLRKYMDWARSQKSEQKKWFNREKQMGEKIKKLIEIAGDDPSEQLKVIDYTQEKEYFTFVPVEMQTSRRYTKNVFQDKHMPHVRDNHEAKKKGENFRGIYKF